MHEFPPGSAGGSSPRARGTVAADSPEITIKRFIPASAGNGTADALQIAGVAVHPRERGERMPSFIARSRACGSSPRARGTVHGIGVPVDVERFIPASAGNGRANVVRAGLVTVHPRERGERRDSHCIHRSRNGSSPRARGTASDFSCYRSPWRFIPASAGNGLTQFHAYCFESVHPRERGERPLGPVSVTLRNGSSPRARGTDPLLG